MLRAKAIHRSVGPALVLLSTMIFSPFVLGQIEGELNLGKRRSSNSDNDKNNKDREIKIGDVESYVPMLSKRARQENFKAINLNTAIEQGLREAHAQKIRGHQDRILDLGWDDTFEDFWYPRLKLSLSSGQQRITRLRVSENRDIKPAQTPSGNLILDFQDYTVFNWGKDYLDYLNNKETYKRNKKILKEEKRELRHELITKYFELVTRIKINKINREQLRHASFIYRLNREKSRARKIPKQQFYQAREEFLRAQQEYQESVLLLDVAHRDLAFLVKDPAATKYHTPEKINFRKINIEINEALKVSRVNNPEVLNSRATLHVAERSYDKALRENLPLPKFTVNFGAYNQAFGPGVNRLRYYNTTGGSSVDIVATVNATWAITGSGGLLNKRSLTSSLLNKNIAVRALTRDKHATYVKIHQTYDRISSFQKQQAILELRTINLEKTFDIVLENYLNKKASFQDFCKTLKARTDAEEDLAWVLFNHLKEKVSLASTIGLDDFPGGNFELLAQKEKSE